MATPPDCDAANPDISGVGVLSAFLASAYLTLGVTIIAFIMGFIPKERTNIVDHKMFRFNARNSQWNQPFQKGILSISDQQIVTGIAILLAGFVQINSISAFHWYIVVYLGWMSSNVHLTTLAVLRGHMQTNRPVRAIRVIGMTILFTLLLCALIPTTSKDFTNSLYDGPCKPEEFTPVTDLWKAEHMQDMDSLRIISIILLVISYIWKVGALFKDSSHFAATWFQEKPGTFLKNMIHRMNSHRRAMKRKRPFIYKLTLWSYSQLMGLYSVSLIIYDLLTSFVASIWILCVVLAWGTVNLLAIRHSYRFYEEREWTFGQLVPVLMLILPVMSISQEFFDHKHVREEYSIYQILPFPPIRQSGSATEFANNIARGASSNLETGMAGSGVSVGLSDPTVSSSPSPHNNNHAQQQASTSKLPLVVSSREAALPVGNPVVDPQLDRVVFYNSRFFKFLFWFVFFGATVIAIAMLGVQFVLIHLRFGVEKNMIFYYSFGLAVCGFVGMLILVVAVGAPFSRISEINT